MGLIVLLSVLAGRDCANPPKFSRLLRTVPESVTFVFCCGPCISVFFVDCETVARYVSKKDISRNTGRLVAESVVLNNLQSKKSQCKV
jgi:hypothetical protein